MLSESHGGFPRFADGLAHPDQGAFAFGQLALAIASAAGAPALDDLARALWSSADGLGERELEAASALIDARRSSFAAPGSDTGRSRGPGRWSGVARSAGGLSGQTARQMAARRRRRPRPTNELKDLRSRADWRHQRSGCLTRALFTEIRRPSERAVLISVIEFAARSLERCTASIDSIAVAAGCGTTAARSAVHRLAAAGYISIVIAGGRGAKSTNVIALVHPDALYLQERRKAYFESQKTTGSQQNGSFRGSRDSSQHKSVSEANSGIYDSFYGGKGKKKWVPQGPLDDFPATGSIHYSPFAGIAREILAKLNPMPDIDEVARAFRTARLAMGKPFVAPRVAEEFGWYCKQWKPRKASG